MPNYGLYFYSGFSQLAEKREKTAIAHLCPISVNSLLHSDLIGQLERGTGTGTGTGFEPGTNFFAVLLANHFSTHSVPRIKIWPAYYLFITGKGRKAEPVLVAKNPLPSGGNAVAIGHEDLSIEGVVRRKFKAKEELTPEERELLRKLRKERRQRAKENKRQEKEEAKRLQITGAKDLKISLISREVLQKFYGKWSEVFFKMLIEIFFRRIRKRSHIFFSL